MKCPSCGYDNKEGAKYCNLCLTSFDETGPENPSSNISPVVPPSSQTAVMPDNQDLSDIYLPLWNRHILITAVTLILGLGAIILAFLFGSKPVYITVIVVWLISTIIVSLTIRCPACDCLLCWKSKKRLGYALLPFIPIPRDNSCPQCGVILRK